MIEQTKQQPTIMTILKLTRRCVAGDGVNVYINMDHVKSFCDTGYGTEISFVDGNGDTVEESPETIINMCGDGGGDDSEYWGL